MMEHYNLARAGGLSSTFFGTLLHLDGLDNILETPVLGTILVAQGSVLTILGATLLYVTNYDLHHNQQKKSLNNDYDSSANSV